MSVEGSSPYVIREGVYGATFKKENESLYLRMELLTEENSDSWEHFKKMSCWVANLNSIGILSGLVRRAGLSSYPKHENMKEATGFTNEEYITFTERAIELKKKTNNKIVDLLEANSAGSNHMYTGLEHDRYIVYISKNRDFSIQKAHKIAEKMSLKNFIEAYNDILISMGSNFSYNDCFYNRGISRNPYWVFNEKYSGLSMYMHGFCGAVADKFLKKEIMRVDPIGSMQYILQKNLRRGDGYIIENGQKKDITDLKVSPEDLEGQMNYIKISALTRIYSEATQRNV